jgi:putative salt-induced outer membrane protein
MDQTDRGNADFKCMLGWIWASGFSQTLFLLQHIASPFFTHELFRKAFMPHFTFLNIRLQKNHCNAPAQQIQAFAQLPFQFLLQNLFPSENAAIILETNFDRLEEPMKNHAIRIFAILLIFVPASFFTTTLLAQDNTGGTESAPGRNWEDTAELSYVQTGGNTEVLTFSGKNMVKYNFTEKLDGSWEVGLLYGKTEGEKNAERYYSDLRLDYNASATFYYYLMGGWEQDKFAGIDRRLYVGPGVGYNIVATERQALSTEAGLDYAKETYTDDTEDDFMEGRFLAKYAYTFTPKTKFTQSAEYLHNFNDAEKYRVNTVTGLTTQLTDMFSLKLTYEVNYQNKPSPETLENTDTTFSAALVVNF